MDMSSQSRSSPGGRTRIAVALFVLVAVAFAVAAIFCSWRVVIPLFGTLPSAPNDLSEARQRLAVITVLLMGTAIAVAKIRQLHGFFGREGVQRVLLVLAFGIAPLLLLEIALRPFLPPTVPKTTIFERDPDLGWRHRPGAEDMWDGQLVRINAKGLRGPDIPYERRPGSTRILFVGDSVTFGDGLANYDETLPARIGAAVARRSGRTVEAINSGVSGYSPWQEARFLRNEGFRYSPDLVVVTFVLNDVTEKFELMRFGGSGEGWQLSHAFTSGVEKWLYKSNIVRGVQLLAARLRFGADTKAGARAAEQLTVRSLVDAPLRDDVKRAWSATFTELDEIVELCRQRQTPLVILVSPFAFQLEKEGSDAPQLQMVRYAQERGVALLDLLGPLADDMKQEKRQPQFYFLDSNHFSANGTSVVAELVSPFLLEISPRAQASTPGTGKGQR